MPTYISNAQSDYVLADNEVLFVLGSGSLSAVGTSSALSSSFGNATIKIAGTLAGFYGAYISGGAGSFTTIALSATASVFSTSYGMWLQAGEMRLSNAGTIMTNGFGLMIGNTGSGVAGVFKLTNTGEISGSIGVYVLDVTGVPIITNIVNHGLIQAQNLSSAAFANEQIGGNDMIENFGTFAGMIMTNGAADTILNRGHILGNIIMGAGDDILDNSRGLDSQNIIDMGIGRDLVYLGLAEEIVGGGTGFDIASYRFGRAVKVNLTDVSQNTGAAAGDFYNGIEQISGSERFADTLIGDGLANWFFGDGGRDTLSGGLGNDTLDGGRDADRVTGGLGNDSFQLSPDNPGADIITDFSNVAGNNDRFLIMAPMLGLAAGAISSNYFRAAADFSTQDSDDFFVFRTTDKTLWLDYDGSGAGAPVMLADLQDSAVVTWQDIVMLAV